VKTLIITRFTLSELKSKRLLILVVAMSALFLLLYGFGMYFFQVAMDSSGSQTSSFQAALAGTVMSLMGLYVVNYLGGLLAVFASLGSISGEIESGTLQAVIPKPLRRTDIVLGKWLAYALFLAIYTASMSAAVLTIAHTIIGFEPPNPVVGVGLMVLQVVLLLSVSILGSTILPTLANGVVVFLLYGTAWLGGLIYSVGSSISSDVMTTIGSAVNFLMPSDFLWKAASYYLQPDFIAQAGRMGVNPFFSWLAPEPGIIMYSVIYTLVVLFTANVVFRHRDI
jgi:Cu-processing system permease protein